MGRPVLLLGPAGASLKVADHVTSLMMSPGRASSVISRSQAKKRMAAGLAEPAGGSVANSHSVTGTPGAPGTPGTQSDLDVWEQYLLVDVHADRQKEI